MAGPNFQPSDGNPTEISILRQLAGPENVQEMYMIHLVSYRILAGRSFQILAETREMVTDTLQVMSMGIKQVSHVRTSQLLIQKFKRSSIRRAPTNQSRSPKFMRRPHFVGDFLCKRSCFNLQLSSESSCKAPSFYVWKTRGRFSDNLCDSFVFRVCYG